MTLNSVQGGETFRSFGLPNNDAMFLQLVVVESMQRVSHFQQNVVGDVDNIINGSLSNSLQARLEPVRRFSNSEPGENPCCIARAQFAILDAHPGGQWSGRICLILGRRKVRRFELESKLGSNFTSDPKMIEAIGTVGRHFHVQDEVVLQFFNLLNCQAHLGQEVGKSTGVDVQV